MRTISACCGRRCLVVHVLLRRHLRRLRRPRRPSLTDLFPRPVRAERGRRRLLHRGVVFVGSLVRPVGGCGGRPHRRRAGAEPGVSLAAMALRHAWRPALPPSGWPCRCSWSVWLSLGHGQWRGVPARAATLRPRDRRDDRPGRHDRRRWAASTWPPAWATRSSSPAATAPASCVFALLAAAALVLHQRRPAALAHDLGCRIGAARV